MWRATTSIWSMSWPSCTTNHSGQLRDSHLPRLPARARHVTAALSGDGGTIASPGTGAIAPPRPGASRAACRLPATAVFGLLGVCTEATGRRSAAGQDEFEALAQARRAYAQTWVRPRAFLARSSRRVQRASSDTGRAEVYARQRRVPGRDPLALVQYLDLRLPCRRINTRSTAGIMAHSLEVREPLRTIR